MQMACCLIPFFQQWTRESWEQLHCAMHNLRWDFFILEDPVSLACAVEGHRHLLLSPS